MRTPARVALIVLMASASWARGENGDIPVYGPITITQPGHYVVTRDISVASGDAIVIRSSNVTLDLNGRTVSNAGGASTDRVVLIDNDVPARGISIQNGRLVGGYDGIQEKGSLNPAQLTVRGVEFSGMQWGIDLSAADSVDVEECHFHDLNVTAIVVYGPTGVAFRGRFVHNRMLKIGGSGLLLVGMRGGYVSDNMIVEYGSNPGFSPKPGIWISAGSVSNAGGDIIEKNTVSVGVDGDGIRVEGSPNEAILGNVVHKSVGAGIWSYGNRNRIENNVADQNTGDGIRVGGGTAGTELYLEANQVLNNGGCGISFNNTQGHIYRNNVSGAANTGGKFCGVAGTIVNGGGNL